MLITTDHSWSQLFVQMRVPEFLNWNSWLGCDPSWAKTLEAFKEPPWTTVTCGTSVCPAVQCRTEHDRVAAIAIRCRKRDTPPASSCNQQQHLKFFLIVIIDDDSPMIADSIRQSSWVSWCFDCHPELVLGCTKMMQTWWTDLHSLLGDPEKTTCCSTWVLAHGPRDRRKQVQTGRWHVTYCDLHVWHTTLNW